MLQLSSAMLQKLNVIPGREVVFSAGSKKSVAAVEKNSADANIFSVDPNTLGKVCLRGINQPLAFFYNKSGNELKIGPIVAILSGIPVMLLDPEVISLYQTIAAAARDAGMLFYIFTPDLIDFENGTVNGFQYGSNSRSSKGWVIQEFPLPDVIYNQVGFISNDLKPVYRKLLLDYLKEHAAVKLINPFWALNDKLVTHKNIYNDRQVKAYLPETRQYSSGSDVLALLKKYGAVHLKPTVSSLGRGIYKVSLHENEQFIVEFHQPKGAKITENIYGKVALCDKLQKIISQQPYLVQQSIDLLCYENRPVDFRVHLFKNARGRWDLLAIKARLGPVAGVVTGPAWGGFRLRGDKLLETVFSRGDAGHILREIEAAALTIARVLGRLFAKEFGELGFDMGVSRNKKVWMIEVNPKPNWNVPPEADAAKAEKNLAEHFLGYCRYLLNLNELNVSVGTPVRNAQLCWH
ncbi:MAG: YheC/YheD family protein [Bacillota bacterium]